ncbi:hypothetical protein BDW22DRAFT_658167 [Trametopsis cervina]|nr:hypothetical protein BDW22DRAFT_658167 [Trametopsis cervina]
MLSEPTYATHLHPPTRIDPSEELVQYIMMASRSDKRILIRGLAPHLFNATHRPRRNWRTYPSPLSMDTNVATSSDVPTVRNPGFSGGEHVYAEDDAVAGSNGPHQDSAQETPSSRTNTTEEKIKHADDSMELTRKKFAPDNTAAGKRPKNRRAAIPPVPPLPAGAAEDLAQSKEEIPSSQDYADTEDLGNKSVIVLEDILPLVSGEEARGETATQPPLPADTVDPQGPPAPPSGSRAPSRDGRMRTSTPHQRPRHESPGTQRIRSWASSDFMKPDIRSGLVIDPSQLSHELLADAYKHEKERTERLLASLIENFQTQLAEAPRRDEKQPRSSQRRTHEQSRSSQRRTNKQPTRDKKQPRSSQRRTHEQSRRSQRRTNKQPRGSTRPGILSVSELLRLKQSLP